MSLKTIIILPTLILQFLGRVFLFFKDHEELLHCYEVQDPVAIEEIYKNPLEIEDILKRHSEIDIGR